MGVDGEEKEVFIIIPRVSGPLQKALHVNPEKGTRPAVERRCADAIRAGSVCYLTQSRDDVHCRPDVKVKKVNKSGIYFIRGPVWGFHRTCKWLGSLFF